MAREFPLYNEQIPCDEVSLEFKGNTFKLNSDAVYVKLGGKHKTPSL